MLQKHYAVVPRLFGWTWQWKSAPEEAVALGIYSLGLAECIFLSSLDASNHRWDCRDCCQAKIWEVFIPSYSQSHASSDTIDNPANFLTDPQPFLYPVTLFDEKLDATCRRFRVRALFPIPSSFPSALSHQPLLLALVVFRPTQTCSDSTADMVTLRPCCCPSLSLLLQPRTR